MNLDVSQKLSSKALAYLLVRSLVWTVVAGVVLAVFGTVGSNYVFLAGFAVLLVVYQILWWSLFEYTVSSDHITTRSGVIVMHNKTVNYNDLQSMNSSVGPLLGIFGLRDVKFFTSSPGQIIISSSRDGGTHTEHKPDVHIILDKQLADEFVRLARSSDVQKVQQVNLA